MNIKIIMDCLPCHLSYACSLFAFRGRFFMNESPAFECAQMSIRAAFVITVEPSCAITSCKRPLPISNRQSKTPKLSQSKPFS